MVDFSEALKARIESMSPDELAATEVRRLTREAGRRGLDVLDALWEPMAGAATTREVTIRIDPAVAPQTAATLKVSQGSTFHETILLVPAAYRLIAGGAADSATMKPMPARFVVSTGAAGYDTVSVDRAALAAIVARHRSIEMARARRLVGAEKPGASPSREALDRQILVFEAHWTAETISARIDAAVTRNASRVMLLMAGKDHVALWVRKDDLGSGPGRILGSPLAAAIVRPERRKPQRELPPAFERSAVYLGNTFGAGPERRLVLDVGRLRKMIPRLPKAEQEQALGLFDRLLDRCAAIGKDRATRLAERALDALKRGT